MPTKAKRLVLAVLPAALALAGCGESGPAGPAVDTPEWLWLAAVDNYAAGDFEKTQDQLGDIVKSDNPWRTRAAVWRVAMLAGMARASGELADAYESGAKKNQARAASFQNPIQQYRRDARRHTIALAETVGTLKKSLGDAQTVPLEFSLPPGTSSPSPDLGRVSDGTILREGPAAQAKTDTIRRGLLLETVKAVNAGDNVAKARSLFEAPPVEIPRAVFFLALGRSLFERSELFDRFHLNEAPKREFMLNRAISFIAPALESDDESLKKEAEELQKEIQKFQEKE
jgi:hypothetical protein